jgi:TIR domain
MSDVSDGERDFFVSFTQADHAWATWVAWALEAAGYSVFFQNWDFKGNFVLEMDKAHAGSVALRGASCAGRSGAPSRPPIREHHA